MDTDTDTTPPADPAALAALTGGLAPRPDAGTDAGELDELDAGDELERPVELEERTAEVTDEHTVGARAEFNGPSNVDSSSGEPTEAAQVVDEHTTPAPVPGDLDAGSGEPTEAAAVESPAAE